MISDANQTAPTPIAPWLNDIQPDRALFQGRAYTIAKRVMDLVIVILALPVVLPVLGQCALLIKLETPEGPTVFTQKRTGKDGVPFLMYKFRTMVVNAEALNLKYAHLNELQWPDFKITNDPRVTRVGRVLRKASLDELPQLLNMLRGEMSLVGPRPTSFASSTYTL